MSMMLRAFVHTGSPLLVTPAAIICRAPLGLGSAYAVTQLNVLASPVRRLTEQDQIIDAIVDARIIRTVFQPIVHLESATVIGFEALSRGPAGTGLEAPVALLAAAERVGRRVELDWLCRVQALQMAADAGLPAELTWFVNVEQAGLAAACPPALMATFSTTLQRLRVVFEVVERRDGTSMSALMRGSEQARRDGCGIAMDDIGVDSRALAMLELLHPDVVKLDLSLIQSPLHATGRSIAAAVRAYTARTGAVIVAEGIETIAHAHRAKRLGATHVQGFGYGRPGRLPASVPAPGHLALRRRHPALLAAQ
jgi:EAL domain-containing protein (putative c-di-GMP-specific phosphodiesterase class I)